MTTPRVFLIQKPKADVDVSTAQRFGMTVVLMEHKIPAFKTDEFARLLIAQAESYAFDPRKDYLCLTGTVIAVSVASAVLFAKYGHLKLLFFNAVTSEYEERVLDVRGLGIDTRKEDERLSERTSRPARAHCFDDATLPRRAASA